MENSSSRGGFWQQLLGNLLGGNQATQSAPTAPAQGIPVDINQDGQADAIAIDSNQDGQADQLQSDANRDGIVDEVAVDTNQDGALDTVYYDKNQDGQFESSARLQQDITINIEGAPSSPFNEATDSGQVGGQDIVSKDEFDPNADVSEWA